MISNITKRDLDTLPAALLPLAKQWMEIDFADKDQLITDFIRQALDFVETATGAIIYRTEIALTPASVDFVDGLLRLPTPLISWKASQPGDPDPVDISAAYSLRIAGVSGVQTFDLVGSYGAAMTLATVAGFDGIGSITATVLQPLTPALQNNVLRLTANYFEFREVQTTTQVQIPSEWRNDLLGGHWVPRC